MENDMDLTLKLGLPNPTVETHLSLNTSISHQGTNVVDNDDEAVRNNIRRAIWGDDEVIFDDDEGARNNVNVNIRVYNYVFQQFACAPNTLDFAPPAPVTPPTSSDYVLLDVPARRAHRNTSLAMANAWDANARWRRGCGGYGGGRFEGTGKCTNTNCNALTTPMWRRGPLGPKSLCNACGIKFRKEEEKRSKRN